MAANLSERINERLANWCPNSPKPQYSVEGWRTIFDAEDALAAKQIADEAKSLGLDTLRRENKELRQRVETLERGLASTVQNFRAVRTTIGMGRPDLEDGAPGDYVAIALKAINGLADRIEKLEAQPSGNMRYAGIWSDAKEYTAGSVTSRKGTAWIATIDSRGLTPGEGSGWTMLAKSDLSVVNKAVRDEVAKQLRSNPTCR